MIFDIFGQMRKQLRKELLRHADDPDRTDQRIVSAFLHLNQFHPRHNQLLLHHQLPASDPFYSDIASGSDTFSFEDLIATFGAAIPDKKAQHQGAVYTPEQVRAFISRHALAQSQPDTATLRAADIACGCGAFLYTVALALKARTGASLQHIIETQLYGLDINPRSIRRCQLLLSLLALAQGEDPPSIDFNLFTGNALDFDWMSIPEIKAHGGFDLVLGNPPYVRARHLDMETRALLPRWKVTRTGIPDLYIPFFEIGRGLLHPTGTLGYITVNSFYKSVNARALRKYFADEAVDLSIVDFGHEQVFPHKLTYTCLCFETRRKSDTIRYGSTTLEALDALDMEALHPIPYDQLDHHRGWLLSNPVTRANLHRIENTGTALGKRYPIKNGIATLSNDTYIFQPESETATHFRFSRNGKSYAVEKAICRDIIKPNRLKREDEIEDLREQVIFPYQNGSTPLALIEEPDFQTHFPQAYAYLSDHKTLLQNRDKGKGDYGAWYAFGRKQALTDRGKKLMFPYIARQPHFVYTAAEDMLIYCGYAIFSDDETELLNLKKLLESAVFDYYMRHTSKPYAAGYYSYAKNYVRHFGVCDLTAEEQAQLGRLEDQAEIDRFFFEKYELKL